MVSDFYNNLGALPYLYNGEWRNKGLMFWPLYCEKWFFLLGVNFFQKLLGVSFYLNVAGLKKGGLNA